MKATIRSYRQAKRAEGIARFLRERDTRYDFRVVQHPYDFTFAIGVYHRGTDHRLAYVGNGKLAPEGERSDMTQP